MSYKFSIIVDTEPFVTIRKCLMCDTHVDGIAKTCHVNCKRCLAKMKFEFGDAKHSTYGKRLTEK